VLLELTELIHAFGSRRQRGDEHLSRVFLYEFICFRCVSGMQLDCIGNIKREQKGLRISYQFYTRKSANENAFSSSKTERYRLDLTVTRGVVAAA
jgi:hypothetical protein